MWSVRRIDRKTHFAAHPTIGACSGRVRVDWFDVTDTKTLASNSDTVRIFSSLEGCYLLRFRLPFIYRFSLSS